MATDDECMMIITREGQWRTEKLFYTLVVVGINMFIIA